MTDALYPRIAACTSPLQLLEVLLQWCRQESKAYGEWTAAPDNIRRYEYWIARAADLVANLSSADYLSKADHVRVQQYFHPDNPDVRANAECVVETRALAEELEERFAAQFVPLLQEEFAPCRPMAAGRLFPVVRNLRVPAQMGVGRRTSLLTTPPESRCPPVDQLSHFSLGLADGELKAVIDVRLRAVASPFPPDRPLRLGVGILNDSQADLLLQQHTPREGDFLLAGPVNGPAQFDAMCRLLALADDHRVDVLVFPELCTDPASARRLIAEAFDRTAHVGLCAFGSFHGQGDGTDWRNTAVARVRGSAVVLEHDKLERFVIKANESPTKSDLREGIRTGRQVRVFHGNGWSTTMLICLDFMSDKVIPLVRALRPTLVLVPAYTRKTTALRSSAQELANGIQATTVLANGPILQDERVVGVFGVPRTYEPRADAVGVGPAVVVPFPPAGTTLPSLCIFEVGEGRILFLSAEMVDDKLTNQ